MALVVECAIPLYSERESNQRGAVFSQDGKWLAYHSDESGPFEVYMQPFPATGAKHRIAQQGGNSSLWSLDGRELLYVHHDGLLGCG